MTLTTVCNLQVSQIILCIRWYTKRRIGSAQSANPSLGITMAYVLKDMFLRHAPHMMIIIFTYSATVYCGSSQSNHCCAKSVQKQGKSQCTNESFHQAKFYHWFKDFLVEVHYD